MEYAPPPRDPESEARGHELRDVAARPVIIFLIGLIVFGGALQAIMSTIMTGYVKQDTLAGVPPADMDLLRDRWSSNDPSAPERSTNQAPPLQRDTTADMIRMYEQEDAFLTLKSPVRDKRTGKVRVSLDRAVDIVARKGLPHRESAPKGVLDPELPYSGKARAYRATD